MQIFFVRDRDMLLDMPFMANWKNRREHVQGQTDFNTKHILNWGKVKLSAKQTTNMKVILRLAYQFIQMEQSGFNDEQNQND